MALIITAIVFGLTLGALYFLIKKWRVKELARRKRRALLAAGLNENGGSADEDDSPASTDDTTADATQTQGQLSKPVAGHEPVVVLVFTEDENARLAACLRELMKDVIDKQNAYLLSVKRARDAHDEWERDRGQLGRSTYFSDKTDGASLQEALAKRLGLASNVVAQERAIVDGLKNILPTKTISTAVAALARELKKLAPYKPTQLSAELAGARLVGQALVADSPNRIKKFAETEAEFRKKTRGVRIGDYKVSRFPVRPRHEQLIARATTLLNELHQARTQLTEVTGRAYAASVAYKASLSQATSAQLTPSRGTREAFDRCFKATEKPHLDLPNLRRTWRAACEEQTLTAKQVVTAGDNVLGVIAEIDAVTEASQDLVNARHVLREWIEEIKSVQRSAQTSPEVIEDNVSPPDSTTPCDPALSATIPPQIEVLKDRMAQCLAVLFDTPFGSLRGAVHAVKNLMRESKDCACPEKPNDTEVGKLLDKLEEAGKQLLAAHRLQYQEFCPLEAKVGQCALEVEAIGKSLAPLLKLLTGPIDTASAAGIRATKLVHQVLLTKLAELQGLLATDKPAPVPTIGQLPVTAETTDAIGKELRAAARSFGFAAAQSAVAVLKHNAAKAVKPRVCSSAPVLDSNLVEIDVAALVEKMEAHLVEHDECSREKAEIDAGCAAAQAAVTTRVAKKNERRTALQATIDKAMVVLNGDPSEDLYIATHAAKKLVGLYTDN